MVGVTQIWVTLCPPEIPMPSVRCAFPLVALLFVGCAISTNTPADALAEPSSTAPAPLIDVDGSSDSADTGCNVILRKMSRTPNNQGGYQTHDNYSWIWTGLIDVSAQAVSESAAPAVLYQYGSDPTWHSVDAMKESDSAVFSQYSVDIWDGLPSSGMSGTSLSNAQIKVIPYLRLTAGGRLFDHNRIKDPLGTYLMTGQNGLQVPEDATACPTPSPQPTPVSESPTISFQSDGTVRQSGAFIATTKVTIAYDINRLTTCRGTHNGYPAWDLLAHVRFLPSGQDISGSVRQFITNQGTPTNQATSIPFSFDLPAGATSIQIWFENTSGAGNNCQAWDSNYSQNYSYPVLQPVGWIGSPVVLMSRGGVGPCDGTDLGQGFNYGTWTRERAAMRNVCFQVWQAGTTDHDNPDLWRNVDTEVHFRYAPADPWQSAYVNFESRVGNNARYAWDLSSMDPFFPTRCLTVPTTLTPDGQYKEARMEFFFTANGVVLTQAGGAPFVGTFDDNAGASCNQ